MHHWILGVGQNEPLEVEEGQIVVSNEVSALAAVDVGLLQGFV